MRAALTEPIFGSTKRMSRTRAVLSAQTAAARGWCTKTPEPRPRAAYPLTVALGIEPRDLAKGRELSFHHSRSSSPGFGVRDELVVVLALYRLAARTVDLLRHAVLLSSLQSYLRESNAKHSENPTS